MKSTKSKKKKKSEKCFDKRTRKMVYASNGTLRDNDCVSFACNQAIKVGENILFCQKYYFLNINPGMV